MNTREKIKMMQAWIDGKIIEYFDKDLNVWLEDISPSWNWEKWKYRIKPTLKYIPFTFEDRELFRNKWIEYKDGIKPEVFINFINEWKVGVDGTYYNYQELLDNFTFLDETPCGKLQENN